MCEETDGCDVDAAVTTDGVGTWQGDVYVQPRIVVCDPDAGGCGRSLGRA